MDLFREQALYTGSQGTDSYFKNTSSLLVSFSEYLFSKFSWSAPAPPLACQTWKCDDLDCHVLISTNKR